MAAKIRFRMALLASALMWSAGTVRAQDATESNAVGPSELQNFNLEGTVTRPADPAPSPAPTPRREPPPSATPKPSQPSPSVRPAPVAERSATRELLATAERNIQERREKRPPISAKLPPISDSPIVAPLGGAPVSATPATIPPTGQLPTGSMLVAIAVLLGGFGLWWFGRSRRRAGAGGPMIDELAAPQSPLPLTAPPPSVAPAAGGENIGIVSTRLRPWLEIQIKPLRCVIDGERVSIEIELTLFNSGNLPARAILLEAAILNAGPEQDRDIDYFFMNPIGAGKRASSLPPLKKAIVRSTVVTLIKDASQYEVEGRMVYVPILAINALYQWPTGEGQSAQAFAVGRDTHIDRLGPFRLDRGPGTYEPLALLTLANGIRA